MPPRHQGGSKLLGALLALVTFVAVVWPGAAVTWVIISGAMKGLAPKTVAPLPGVGGALETLPPLSLAPSLPLLIQTLAWAIGIGVIATILAWPAAWVIRRYGWGVVGLICVPLMLPTYLAYSAFNILRSPGWLIGDWVERLAQAGWSSAPSLAGRVVAAVGLSLWAWPIAAVVLGASVKGLDSAVLDALRLERMSTTRRRLEVLWLCRAGIIGAIAAVGLITIGSAVPLHLAQVPTYAIKVWLDLTLAPGSWRVWAAAWPLILIALIAGWVIAARALRSATGPEPAEARGDTSSRRSLTPPIIASLIWTCSVLVPLGLFIATLHEARAIPRFWKVGHESVTGSLLVSLAVSILSIAIAASVWQSLSARRSAGGLVLWCTRAFLVAGIIPGVLVGSAVSSAVNMTDATSDLSDSAWVLVLGHIARFGFVPALMGCWLAAIEPRQERELRSLDGGLGLTGWAMACLPVQAGALLAAGLAAGALSLHEIEAAVVLQPPGSPSLAQLLLNYLHQLRMQDLSAAGVVLVSGGLVAAGVAAAGMWWTARSIRGWGAHRG